LEHIQENANINVSDQCKSAYKELIVKYFKVISIGKTDLELVKDFLHKIHLRNN
jgi:hypothetical protein